MASASQHVQKVPASRTVSSLSSSWMGNVKATIAGKHAGVKYAMVGTARAAVL